MGRTGYLLLLMTVGWVIGCERSQNVNREVAKAQRFMDQGQYDEAIRVYSQILQRDPRNLAAYMNRMIAYQRKGDHHKTIEQADAIVNDLEGKEKALVHLIRAHSYREKGQHQNAIRGYSFALGDNPSDPDLLIHRGECYRELRQWDEAVKDYTMAIELAPDDSEAYLGRAYVFQASEDYARAVNDFSRAIQLGGPDPILFHNRAMAYLLNGDLEEAKEDLDRCIELSPEFGHAYDQRGMIQGLLGNLEEAIRDCERALELDSSLLVKGSNRGHVYRKRKEYAKAVKHWEEVLAVAEGDPNSHLRLSELLSCSPNDEVRDGTRALEHAKIAHDLTSGTDWHSLRALALAHAELGNFEEAGEYLAKAIELAPDQSRGSLEKCSAAIRQSKAWRME